MRRARRAYLAALIVAPVAVFSAARAAQDPLRPQQWALDIVGAPASGAHGSGVVVAVVDTGVDVEHEDLRSRLLDHVSCIGADDDPDACSGSGQDDNGHGTHVAGIALAAAGNGRGVEGVAPEARLLAVRALAHDPATGGASGSSADVRAGIRWAVDHGADVINLSLGPEITLLNLLGSPLRPAIDEAWAAGAVVTLAAGNSGIFPSGYGNIDAIVVTATDREDRQASYASGVGGAQWGMAAPGGESGGSSVGIVSTYWEDGEENQYASLAGTSMATPHVAGAAAALRSLGLSPQQTLDRLLETAKDLGSPGEDGTFGSGRLDVAAATDGLVPAGGDDDGGTPAPRSTTTSVAAAPTTTGRDVVVQAEETARVEATPRAGPAPTVAATPPPEPAPEGDQVAVPIEAPGGGGDGGLGPWPWVAALALLGNSLGLRSHLRRLPTLPA